ncbi:MAG: hypothetical protein K2G70_06410 [Turicibacter sp.]|nr:hypothetical protein [Turicibacter sp.]
MKKRKVNSNSVNIYAKLEDMAQYEDTRYYGIFLYGNKKQGQRRIKVDPKRYQKKINKLSPAQLNEINKRHHHYFYPAKKAYLDYNCNIFLGEIKDIKSDWYNTYKALIQREQERIKKPKEVVPADDYNFMCGITDYEESSSWAFMTNLRNSIKYKREVNKIVGSLYSQFFHQMASRIEAITVYVLSRNGKNVEHFDRNALYDYAGVHDTARNFFNYSFHDKLYCIWHFIKHNSLSTYNKLKSKYPEILVEAEFKQGYLAYTYVKFSENLILELLNGCGEFFKEYCQCVYHENFEEAQWNYDDYFLNPVDEEIQLLRDPFGLSNY